MDTCTSLRRPNTLTESLNAEEGRVPNRVTLARCGSLSGAMGKLQRMSSSCVSYQGFCCTIHSV